MILYEYRRGSYSIGYRPTFRVRIHTNPILKSSRVIRIIRNKTISNAIKRSTSLTPKHPSKSITKTIRTKLF